MSYADTNKTALLPPAYTAYSDVNHAAPAPPPPQQHRPPPPVASATMANTSPYAPVPPPSSPYQQHQPPHHQPIPIHTQTEANGSLSVQFSGSLGNAYNDARGFLTSLERGFNNAFGPVVRADRPAPIKTVWNDTENIVLSDDHYRSHNKWFNGYLFQIALYTALIAMCAMTTRNWNIRYWTNMRWDSAVLFFLGAVHWFFAPIGLLIATVLYMVGICGSGNRAYVRDTFLTAGQAATRLNLHKVQFGFDLFMAVFFFIISISYAGRTTDYRWSDGYYSGASHLSRAGVTCQWVTLAYALLVATKHNMVFWASKRLEFLHHRETNAGRVQ